MAQCESNLASVGSLLAAISLYQQRFTETNEAFEPEIYSVFGTKSQNCSFFMKQNMEVPFS